jgi:hypothetical protein
MNAVDHFPSTLPRLRWFGAVVEPTSGDTEAIFAGAVRLMRGERIVSTTPKGERVLVSTLSSGRTVVMVGNRHREEFASAFDALLVAYESVGNFNVFWRDCEGRWP